MIKHQMILLLRWQVPLWLQPVLLIQVKTFFLYCLSGALKLLFYVACLLNNIMLLPFCSQSLFSCAQHVQITRALLEVPMIPVVCIFLVLKITFCSGQLLAGSEDMTRIQILEIKKKKKKKGLSKLNRRSLIPSSRMK